MSTDSSYPSGEMIAQIRQQQSAIGLSPRTTHIFKGDRTADEAALDFNRMVYMYYMSLDTQIGIAETKAQLIMGANAIIIASMGFNQNFMGILVGPQVSGAQIGLVALTALMLVFLGASVYFALTSTRPNLRRPRSAMPDTPSRPNLFFFGNTAAMSAEQFESAFLTMTMDEIKRDVIGQIHAKSTVVTRKYRLVNRSVWFLFFALTCWGLSRGLLAFV